MFSTETRYDLWIKIATEKIDNKYIYTWTRASLIEQITDDKDQKNCCNIILKSGHGLTCIGETSDELIKRITKHNYES